MTVCEGGIPLSGGSTHGEGRPNTSLSAGTPPSQTVSYRDGVEWRMLAWSVDALYADLA